MDKPNSNIKSLFSKFREMTTVSGQIISLVIVILLFALGTGGELSVSE